MILINCAHLFVHLLSSNVPFLLLSHLWLYARAWVSVCVCVDSTLWKQMQFMRNDDLYLFECWRATCIAIHRIALMVFLLLFFHIFSPHFIFWHIGNRINSRIIIIFQWLQLRYALSLQSSIFSYRQPQHTCLVQSPSPFTSACVCSPFVQTFKCIYRTDI